MTGPASRRSFQRGLTTLPLIGGSVALIGSPTRAADPVTPGTLATYAAWLHYERRALMDACFGPSVDMTPCMNPGSYFHFERGHTWGATCEDAKMRAPIVLAAVGCPLSSSEAEAQWSGVFPGPDDLWLPAR